MNSSIQGRRQPLPTILTVYRPIEEYRESNGSADAAGIGSSDSLDPLDAFLVHRLLDLVPGIPVLIDEAMGATGGASSLIGLNHPRVRGVWGVADRGEPGCHRTISALRGHLGHRAGGLSHLEVVTRPELPDGLADRPGAVILAHAQAGGAGSMAAEVGWWLDRRRDALVLVLGLGRVGHCGAISSLMNLCTPESGMRFELLRELTEVLISSRLGLVARRDDPDIDELLERLRQSFSGNYRYIDLLRQVNDAALREARIDVDALRSHPTFGPMSEEIEGLKRIAQEAEARAVTASMALREALERPTSIATIATIATIEETLGSEAPPPMPAGRARRLAGWARRRLSPTPVGGAWRLAKRVRRRLSPTPIGVAWHLARRVRQKLSPTPVGGAWRLARRVRRKLSPTPVGGAYRLAKRGLGACLGLGR